MVRRHGQFGPGGWPASGTLESTSTPVVSGFDSFNSLFGVTRDAHRTSQLASVLAMRCLRTPGPFKLTPDPIPQYGLMKQSSLTLFDIDMNLGIVKGVRYEN